MCKVNTIKIMLVIRVIYSYIRQGDHVFGSVGLFVCLFVSNLTLKAMKRFHTALRLPVLHKHQKVDDDAVVSFRAMEEQLFLILQQNEHLVFK